jgi:hypothetical protein
MSHANEFWNFENADRSENNPKGYFTPLFPHNLGRPLHHPEQDYNAHLIGQIVKGFRVVGSGPDGEMTQDDLELGIKLHEVNPGDGTPGSADADYSHYIEAGAKDYEWIWVPAEMGGTSTSPLSVSGVVTDKNDCTGTFAAITAQATGGQPMYEFSLQTSNAVNFGNITDWTTSNSFTVYNGAPLVPGQTYYIYIKDAANTNAISSVLTPTEIVSHTADLQVTQHVTQPGGNDAEITATVNGGVGPFTYMLYQGASAIPSQGTLIESIVGTNNTSIVFPVNASGNSTVSIGTGTYFVTIEDGTTSCLVGSSIVTVNQPQPLNSTYIKGNALCHQGTHSFTFNGATGGTAPYEYSITDPSVGYTWSTDLSYTGIPAGPVSIFPAVKDSTGFILDLGTVTFEDPDDYSFSVSPNDANCAGAAGSITFGALQGGPGPNVWPLPREWSFSIDNGQNWSAPWTEINPGDTYTYMVPGAGTYACRVRRSNSSIPEDACSSAFQTVVVGEADTVDLDYNSVDDIICGTNGSGEINISNILIGGQNASLDYSVEWTNAANPGMSGSDTSQTADSYNIANLDAGTYNVVVTNTAVTNGCTYTFIANIQNATSNIQLTIDDSMDPSCNGATDGYVDLSVSNGTAPYTYSYNTGGSETILEANSPNNTWVDASGGFGGDNYVFTVSDANGCSDSVSITLNDPAEVVASIAIDNNNVCNGQSGGQLTASATGGDGNYTYAWSNGETTPTINTLFAGTYSVVVTDGNGCVSNSVSEDILEYAQIDITLDSQTNVTCNGGSDGSANITVIGDGPFTYQWVDLADGITIVSTDQNPTGLSAGNYAVGVIGAGGCGGNPTWTLNITEPIAISYSVITVDETITGQNNGSATITVGGGTPEYSVSVNGNTINGTAGQTAFVFSNLTPGLYSYTITDDNGCTEQGNFTIATGSSGVTIDSLSQTDTPCHGGETTVSMVVSGGSTNYEFSEDGTNWIGAINGATTPYTFTFPTLVGAGTYTYYVKDTDTSDQDDQQTIVIDYAIPSATVTPTHETVAGADDGEIEVTNLTGGTGTYVSVELFDSNDNSVGVITAPGPYKFTGLPDGTYTIEIKDDNDCSGPVGTQVLPGGAQLNASVAALNNPILCYGGTTDVTMTITGGTGTFRFSNDNGANWTNYITTNTYTWNNVSATDTSIWPIGVPYMVEDQDTSAPASQQTHYLIVTENTQVSPTPTTQNESIDGQNDGSVTIDVAGGVADYGVQIQHTDGSGQTINGTGGQTQFVFTGLAPGQYAILGADSNGCPISGQFTIAQGAPQVSITSLNGINATCHGGPGQIDMVVTGGSGDYQYSVSPASSNNPGTYGPTTQLTTETWQASAGTWWLFVKDAVTGDEDGLSVSISQPSPWNVSFNGAESYPGANDASIEVFITGGTAPYSISCTETGETLTGLPSSAGPTPSGTFTSITSAGTYNFVITDVNGCTYGPQTTIGTIYTNIAITNVIDDTVCYGETNGQIKIYPSGGSGNYEFSRNGGSSYSSANYSTYGYGLFLQVAPGSYDVWIRDTFTGEELEWSSNPVVISEAQEIQVISETMTDGTCSTYPSYTMTFSGSNITQVLGNQQVRIKFTSPVIAQVSATVTATGTPNVYQADYTSAQWQQLDNNISQYDFTSGTFNLEIESDDCEITHGPISYTTSDSISIGAIAVSEPACPSDDWVYELTATGGPSSSYTVRLLNGGVLQTNWDGTATQFNIPQNGGNSTIIVEHTDIATNSCGNTVVVTANNTSELVVSGSVNNPNCASSGGSTMSFSITGGQPSGNTYKYKVSTDGGSSYGSEQSYTGPVTNQSVANGTIVIKAYRISNGSSTESTCSAQETLGTVTNPVAISGQVVGSSSPTGCIAPNNNNGSITMTVSGGTGVYEFSKDGGTLFVTLTASGGQYTFDNLTAGSYGIVAKDSNGCPAFTDNVVLTTPSSPTVSSHNFQGCWRDADGAQVELNIFLTDITGQQNGDYSFYDPNADVQTVYDGKFTYSNSDMTYHTQGPVTITDLTTGCPWTMNSFNFTSVPAIQSSAGFFNLNNSGSGSDNDDFKVSNVSGGLGAPYWIELIDSSNQIVNAAQHSGGNTIFYDVPAGFYTYKIYDYSGGSTGCGRSYTTPMESIQVVTNERTIYYFHGGQSAFPYASSYLTNPTCQYYTPATAPGGTTSLSDAMTEIIDNGGTDPYNGGAGAYTVDSFDMPAGQTITSDGTSSYTQWTFAANGVAEYYYLAVPKNGDFPEDLITAPPYNLMDNGVPTNAAEKKEFTYNGEDYWLYRMGGGANTIARSFGFNN